MLEINTTVPSIETRYYNRTNCNFNASLEMNVAFVTFSGKIELKDGSKINVNGKYALSITSQNGNIILQTDINMTCNKETFSNSCLGGFTQSQVSSKSIYKGEGIMIKFHFLFSFYNLFGNHML